MGFRVLMTDRAWPDAEIERRILSAAGGELVEAPTGDEATLVRMAAGVQAIATNWAKVTPAVIAAAGDCKIVCRMGIGLDNIAIPAATERGMLVTNIPDYCVPEVADHALAMLLAGARNIAFFHHRTKRGEYALQAGPAMRRLEGRTLGLVGMGRISQNLIPKARAFGLKIIGWSRSGNGYGTGVDMVPFDTLLAGSDYISIHAPLTPETRHLFSLPQFQKMRREAWLINTSRGPLVNPGDLWAALQQNLIAGAALDVFDPEPPNLNDPLYHDERVIVTPHAAFVSEESLADLRARVARQIVDAMSGKRPENIRNGL